MNRKIKYIFENFNFLAKEPFKIGVSLGIIGFAIVFGLFGWDIYNNVAHSLGSFLIVINLMIIIAVIIYVAYMRELPKAYDNRVCGDFNYKQSLQHSRMLQRDLVSPVESSNFNYSAKSQIQKYNNELRLLSFVAVFEQEAYIFIRLPKSVAARREMDDLKEVASDIALSLGMRTSSFQMFINNQNIALGYVSRAKYVVMRLS